MGIGFWGIFPSYRHFRHASRSGHPFQWYKVSMMFQVAQILLLEAKDVQ